MWRRSLICFLLLQLVYNTLALKLDLFGGTDGKEVCVGQYIPKDLVVVVEVTVGEGDRQTVSLVVRDRAGNRNTYFSRSNLKTGSTTFPFTSHDWTDIEFCFVNKLDSGVQPTVQLFRTIHLHVDTGAEAKDYSEVAKKEKLSQLEVELQRLENLVASLESDIAYLHKGEATLRDLNEDANERVRSFSTWSIIAIVAVGLWQIWYLRSFFKTKKLI